MERDVCGHWRVVVNVGGEETTLREATEADVEAILKMSREASGPWDYYPSSLLSLFHNPRARVFVAEGKGEIVSTESCMHYVALKAGEIIKPAIL